MKRSLFALLFLKAILFVVLIPPWQVPDEPAHVHWALHFREPNGDWITVIRANLEELETARYSEGEGYLPGGPNQYPPLYYRLVSTWVPASSLLGKLYILRLYSVVLQALLFAGCVWLMTNLIKRSPVRLTSHPGDLGVLREFHCASLVGATALLLPQTCLLFSGVNPDLLACVIVTFVLAILAYFFNLFGSPDPIPRTQSLICVILLVGLLAAAVMTKLNALIVLPVTVLAVFLLPLQFRSWRRWRNYILVVLVLAAGVFLAASALQNYAQDETLGRVRSMSERVLDPLGTLSKIPPGLIGRFFAILYVSFWYSYGWMVYKMSIAWYFAFTGIVVLSSIGWLWAAWRQINWMGVFVCTVTLLVSIWVVFLERGPLHSDEMTQARFIFSSLGTIIGLMAVGWATVFSMLLSRLSEQKPARGARCKPAIALLTCFFLFLNTIVVFKYLIPTFYLR